jgi:uncharacterized protein (DUF305 family)
LVSGAGRIVGVVVVAVVGLTVGVGIVVAALAGGGPGEGEADGGSGDDGARTVQPGAPGEPSRELGDDEAPVEVPEHSPTDTAFMQDMVVHHRQAMAMTALVADRTERDDLPVLAERITETQETEIDQVERWLTDRGEDVPDSDGDSDDDHAAHDRMPGMATADQLDRLEASSGPAFDRLFLDLMIAHHQGALTMVEQLYAAGGGLEPAADRFARDVEADQDVEILRMQELLDSII